MSQDGTTTIDVRGLQPPQPLIDILTILDGPDAPDRVVVLHDRNPILLYPELEARGWTWTKLPSPEGELHLALIRISGAEGE